MRQRIFIKRLNDLRPITAITALKKFSAPAYLAKDGRETARALTTTPAIDQGLPATVFITQFSLDMCRGIARNNRRPEFAGLERALLNVNRADFGALFVAHYGQVDRAGHMILGKFRR